MVPRNAVEPNVTENDPKRSTEPTAGEGDTEPNPQAASGISGATDRHPDDTRRAPGVSDNTAPAQNDEEQADELRAAATDDRMPASDLAPASARPSSPAPTAPDRPARRGGRAALVVAVIALLAALAAGAWTMNRFQRIESELTRRLQAIDQRGSALDTTLKQAQDLGRDMQGRLALLERKVAETAGLQAQVDKLYRDRAEDSFEVTLVEAESGLALAAQQLSLGANPQAVLARLEDLQAKLERENDARLAPLRGALIKDVERLRMHPATDVGSLAHRIDALIAALDQLPLLSAVREPAPPGSGVVAASEAQPANAQGAAAQQASTAASPEPSIGERVRRSLRALGGELRELFQVRRIDSPDVMLVAPEQAYFLRQNLRLMLLDARLALLTRNDTVYRSDLERARRWIDSYYDTGHRNVEAVQAQLRQLLDAKLMLEPPRIDESLAAVRSARAGGR